MNAKILNTVIEKTKELLNAPSCCAEAKEAANAFLSAIGTPDEVSQTRRYLAELKADIVPIDGLIAFASSEAGIAHFGPDLAQTLLAHANTLKASGEAYCDCPACAAVRAILELEPQML